MPDAGRRDAACSITLMDGAATRTREAAPVDLTPVQELHRRCSLGSRALRYNAGKSQLSPAEWHQLSNPERGTTLVTTPAERTDHIIAMTNVMRTHQQGVGELAILVEDGWQARGLGTALAEHAAAVARREGHHTLAATVAVTNKPMLHVLQKLDATAVDTTGPVLDLRIPL
ncbi:GNAT family N-acetyltransferase [Streptomyces phaeoluteigriseus]|uniref:GNAT family N-acetyltransferase n=1 Tax=Streptomyces phaeoluteigriseus TaxID=114686 RepID=A0A1V6MZC5_9ACTN|nr:GNAT family N-acetyltransferase [Streptomyces phaeoluteigriseus]OQD57666.1 GNAT family N-acetyltransferase [Streptomyces phaeoluteigriseus]